jgi:hypothetical protein
MVRMLNIASEAMDVARKLGDRRTVRMCLSYILSALEYGPAPLGRALERATGFLETFGGDRSIEAGLLDDRAMVNACLGRGEQARADAGASRAIAEEIGQQWLLWDYPVIDGYIAWLERDLARAEARLREGIQVRAAEGDRVNIGFYGPSLARVLLARGRDVGAEELLLDFRDNRSVPTARANALSIAAVIAARRDEIAKARRLSAEAVALVASTECLTDQADIGLDRAEVLLLAGRRAEAHAAVDIALGRFERKEHAIGIRRAREFLAALPS